MPWEEALFTRGRWKEGLGKEYRVGMGVWVVWSLPPGWAREEGGEWSWSCETALGARLLDVRLLGEPGSPRLAKETVVPYVG